MRWMGTRWFSLSAPHARQALFKPYIEPMNKGQEKHLRKSLFRQEPSLHNRIPTDVDRILQLHSPSQIKLKKRSKTIAWLNELIKTTFGNQFSVQNVSLNQYAWDLEYAPLQLVIVDHNRRNGFPPGSEHESRIGPYDPMNLVKILQEHNLTGTLRDGDAFDLLPPLNEMLNMEELDPPPLYLPWSEPTSFSVPYIRYPVVVHSQGTENLLSFYLSPPAPTIAPLISLFKAYFSSDVLKKLVTFIYFWMRTVGLKQLSPPCVALMVIAFLQFKKAVPVLQNPENKSVEELQKADTGVWVVADFPPRFSPQSFYIETGFFAEDGVGNQRVEKHIKQFLYGFLEFWATHNLKSPVIASEQIFSVRTGIFSPRPSAVAKDSTARHHIQERFAKIQGGIIPWSPLEPPITWLHQPIVIQDPFIPSFNHARTLTPHACRFLHNAASVSRRTLFHGHSVHNILGPALKHYKKNYSTSALSQQIKDSYKALTPSTQVFEGRKLTISRIEKVIKQEFGNQFYLLNFGSTRYGVSVENSDLDLVIIDPSHPVGLAPHINMSKLPPIYSVKQVGHAFASYGFTNVFAIPNASVPIVRCRDPRTDINCDININDRLGLINTYLIDNYCKLAPNIRPMCVAIKRWAKYHNLNDSSGILGPRTFSSYTLVLMVIGYLQMKGILPNLQEGFPPLPSNPRKGVFHILRKKKSTLCDTRFREVDPGSTSQTDFELGEALFGWFNFWGNEFNYITQLLDIRYGGLTERALRDQVRQEKRSKKRLKVVRKGTKSELKKSEFEPIEDWHPETEMDNDSQSELTSSELAGEETEEDAWHEQEKVRKQVDEISEKLPATELNLNLNVRELEDEPLTEVPKSTMQSNLKTWNASFVIVDPFNHRKNLTSHIDGTRFRQFLTDCRSAAELIKGGGTLDDLIPMDLKAKNDVDDDDAPKKTKKKKKQRERLGIHIKPSATPKDIDAIDITSWPHVSEKNHTVTMTISQEPT